ncbi:MAG: hypothetical protein L0I24_23610, partial [Pseudonocardia sp.]|nr:hypothetical protein [Pseudonocardia sp.]
MVDPVPEVPQEADRIEVLPHEVADPALGDHPFGSTSRQLIWSIIEHVFAEVEDPDLARLIAAAPDWPTLDEL